MMCQAKREYWMDRVKAFEAGMKTETSYIRGRYRNCVPLAHAQNDERIG
jgi:hypothetical protein